MSDGWCPFARRLNIATGEHTDVLAYPQVSIAEHISAGSDSRSWLQFADNGSSVHFLMRIENGVVVLYQFMTIHWAAWGNGRFSRNNPFAPKWIKDFLATCPDTAAGRAKASRFLLSSTISVEHEGVAPNKELFAAYLDMDIRLNKWLKSEIPTIIADREHIIGHYQIDNVNRPFCPGGPGGLLYPFDKVIAGMNASSDHTFPETNVTVKADFYAFWLANGGLAIFGYPIRAERDMPLPNGTTIRAQSFERARMERHPDGIKLGLVEAERLALVNQ